MSSSPEPVAAEPEPAPFKLDEYRQPILQAIVRILPANGMDGNRERDDIEQEATIAVWRAHVKRGLLPPSLAYTVAYRAAIDYLRKERKLKRNGRADIRHNVSLDRHIEETRSHPADGRDQINYLLTVMDYESALSKISSPRQRQLSDLHVRDGYPISEACTRVGYTLESARQAWGQRVRPRLQKCMTCASEES